MAAPKFIGKYASIRKDFYKGTVGSAYFPGKDGYKTERGYYNAMEKKFKLAMVKLNTIEVISIPTRGSVTIERAKNGQCNAVLRYFYIDPSGKETFKTVRGNRTTGNGYDRLSAAYADALNESPQFMKILLDARAKGKAIPYGADLSKGEPWWPHYMGGIGVNSLNKILESAGYIVEEDTNMLKGFTGFNFVLKNRRI